MFISSCKMATKGEKADYHLRLVQIKLRKNVCKSLWTKCASISNYLIHVMLSYLLWVKRMLCSRVSAHIHSEHAQVGRTWKKWRNAYYDPLLRKRLCKHSLKGGKIYNGAFLSYLSIYSLTLQGCSKTTN